MSFTEAFNEARNRRMAWDAAVSANANAEKLSQAYAAIRERDAEIERLSSELKVQKAMTSGREAQADALSEAHPASPLLAPSGKFFSDPKFLGTSKNNLRLIFERAFDAKAASLGIRNPASLRMS